MFTLTVKLKQHTPLIHFQHDQEGATLRASEVKPKLDRFILGRLTQAEKKEGEKAGWIKTKNDRTWLDYKMRITAKGSSFSKGIKIINADKTAVFQNQIAIGISTTDSDVIPIIRKYICEFFIVHNFGFRQSKGYGSYTVTHLDNEPVTLAENVSSILERTYTGGVASFLFTPILSEFFTPMYL